MVKPLTFKGDKKTKKRKRQPDDISGKPEGSALEPSSKSTQPDGPADEDHSWVSTDLPTDITGPVVIVLPSSPPTCIACDVNGKIFASEIENMVEGNPNTAEPHDVRQVWVATKIAGTEGLNFKGHHGKYLACDKYGILSATSSAVSTVESFVAIPSPDSPGLFSFQICGGDMESYLTITEKNGNSTSTSIEIRGDSTSVSFSTAFRVRMQARFKPRSKNPSGKERRALERITRKELEDVVGRKLGDDDVKRLRKARREGNYHEEVLDVRVKGKHDKFAS